MRRGPTGAATEAAEREIVELLKSEPGWGRGGCEGNRVEGGDNSVEEVAGSRRDYGRGQRRLASDGGGMTADEVASVTPSRARWVKAISNYAREVGGGARFG